MPRDVRLLSGDAALDPALAHGWDALPAARGDQADLYDTHAWLAAWADAVEPSSRALLSVPCAIDGGAVVAALPLVRASAARWEIAGLGFRPRWRPVFGTAEPDVALLAELAAAAASAGARDLSFPALPERDPGTHALAAALASAGFVVERRTGSSECLARVDGGWAGHRSRFKKFERTAKNFANKAERLGPVALDAFGAPGAPDVLAAWPAYEEVHGRGWKGALAPRTAVHRRALLARAQERGWARAYVLRVAGVPVAAILWFRLGPVAIAYSTVYDAQMAALSAGTVVMWQSHERVFAEGEPALVDLLPGHGPQKDQLGPDRTALVTLEARRGRARIALGGLARGARAALRPLVRASRGASAATTAASAARGRTTTVSPSPAPAAWTARAIVLDPRLEILLAVAGGHNSPAAMTATWSDGDAWYHATSGGEEALLRVAEASSVVHEIVFGPGARGSGPEAPVTALAALLGRALTVVLPGGDEPVRPVAVSRSRFALTAPAR